MKNFCAMPFHHTTIKPNGDYTVCCQHTQPLEMNINTHTIDQWRQSAYIKEVQNFFLNDQRHPGCKSCWKVEDEGFKSYRQRTINEYKLLEIDVDQKQLTNVEISLTNLCNLKCLMCNENSSSAILAENTKLNINHVQQKDLEWSENAFKNLDNLLSQNPKVLNIRGGEPLYNKQLLKIVEDMPADRARSMVLHITTNATVWNQRWQNALKKFKLIRFMFSIDASDELYEYIRFPGHWNLVESNVQQMMSLSNVKGLVNCVVQNLNISYLEGLIRWCQDHNLWMTLDILQKPDYLHYTNLTDPQKDIALSNLQNVLKIHPEKNVLDAIKNCIKELEKSRFDQDNWNQFVDKISLRDQLRGNDYRRFIT